MTNFTITAMPDEVAEHVRTELRDLHYDYPATRFVPDGSPPCRSCLESVGGEEALLFNYDFFSGEEFPQPSPVFVHADRCERYPETDRFPESFSGRMLTFEAYAPAQRLLATERGVGRDGERIVERLLAENPEARYVNVRSVGAGCFVTRAVRAEQK